MISFTVLPDIDIFFGLHRGFSHSVVIPIFLTILGTITYCYYHYFNENSSLKDNSVDNYRKTIKEKRSFWGRCTIYGGILWLIHIILDFDLPLAIFYPISDRLYTLNFAILFDLMPWLIFPVMIVGIVFELTGISYLQGISIYFVNLTPSERVAIYGSEPIAISIDDLFIHVILFVIFLAVVARPMLPDLKITQRLSKKRSLSFDSSIMALGMILVIFGFFLGPFAGTHTRDSNSISGTFRVSTSTFSPVLAITFESTNYLLQPNTNYAIKGTLITSAQYSPFNHSLLLTSLSNYNTYSSAISALFHQYPFNTSDNIAQFEVTYQIILQEFTSSSISMNSTTFNETTIQTNLKRGSYALIAIIDDWNTTKVLNGTSLTESAQLNVIVTSNRFSLMIIGLISIISGTVLSVISIKIKR
ncbi:MAG: hypothetical protein ACXACU_02330 [Candidatus Hodarchaeales archaeon]